MGEQRQMCSWGSGLTSATEFGDKIIDAAGLTRAAFSCVPNQSAQETCQGGENFCVKAESMFASLIN